MKALEVIGLSLTPMEPKTARIGKLGQGELDTDIPYLGP